MAFTALGKQEVMDKGIDGATRYITLWLADGTTQLSGHGYSPKAVLPAQMNVGTGGVTTLPANLAIYTANDGSAQRASKVGLARDSDGSNALMTPEDIENSISNPLPPAPINGQTLELSITLNP